MKYARIQNVFKGSDNIYTKYIYKVGNKCNVGDFVSNNNDIVGRIICFEDEINKEYDYKKLKKINKDDALKMLGDFNVSRKVLITFNFDLLVTKDNKIISYKQMRILRNYHLEEKDIKNYCYDELSKYIDKHIKDMQDYYDNLYDNDDDLLMGEWVDGYKWMPLY